MTSQVVMRAGHMHNLKPAFHEANLFVRTEKNATWLGGDKHWRHHHLIIFTFCLFARKKSPSGKRALVVTAGNTPCNVIMHNVITMVNNEATHMRWYVQIIDRSRIQVDTMESWNKKSNLRPTYFLYSWIDNAIQFYMQSSLQSKNQVLPQSYHNLTLILTLILVQS
jgi:hypothetical protein